MNTKTIILKRLGGLSILLNCVLRMVCPSQYVPYQYTCKSWWGSPYTARTIATVAELAFYHQAVVSLELQPLWYTPENGADVLLWLWMLGESLSWCGLIMQNAIANAIEDFVWCIWFILAYAYSKRPIRFLFVPVIFVYLLWHLPNVVHDVLMNTGAVHQKGRESLVNHLDASGNWVIPSVLGKLLLYVILHVAEPTSEQERIISDTTQRHTWV